MDKETEEIRELLEKIFGKRSELVYDEEIRCGSCQPHLIKNPELFFEKYMQNEKIRIMGNSGSYNKK